MSPEVTSALSEIIAENFGPNATYVEGLLSRFRNNPELVDESWRAYFAELIGDGESTEQPDRNGHPQSSAAPAQSGPASAAAPTRTAEAAPAAASQPPAKPAPEPVGELVPIRGASLKIVENMETSLSVPTATSQRRIPVKLLDENRRIINKFLAENDRGKASYTHLIAWALLRALDEFPQLNDGFEVIDYVPTRVKREDVHLGIAVDFERKDRQRTLLLAILRTVTDSL